MKKLFVLVSVIVALAVFAAPVSAIAPTQYSYTYVEEGTLVAACDGFDVLVDATWYINDKIFYDNEGNPLRIAEHISIVSSTYYNSVTLKSAGPSNETLNVTIDLATGEVVGTGVQYHLVVPGEGTILIDVGRLVFDGFPNVTSASGTHPVYFPEEGGLEKLCSNFAE